MCVCVDVWCFLSVKVCVCVWMMNDDEWCVWCDVCGCVCEGVVGGDCEKCVWEVELVKCVCVCFECGWCVSVFECFCVWWWWDVMCVGGGDVWGREDVVCGVCECDERDGGGEWRSERERVECVFCWYCVVFCLLVDWSWEWCDYEVYWCEFWCGVGGVFVIFVCDVDDGVGDGGGREGIVRDWSSVVVYCVFGIVGGWYIFIC